MLAMDDSKNKVIERPLYTWDESPYEDIRERAAMIRAQALCPVTSKPVNFVCPYSGIPHITEGSMGARQTISRVKSI